MCVKVAATVVEDDGAAAASPVDAAIQTKGWLCFLNEFMDHTEQLCTCIFLRWLFVGFFPDLDENG